MNLFSKSPWKNLIFFLLLLCLALLGPSALAKSKKAKSAPASESKNAAVSSVRFFTFGDWGTGTEDQRAVADQTKKICEELQCDFGLSLGDNFYPIGVATVDDPYWNSRYRDYYSNLKVPFYAALGNHDWKQNPQAQIDFTKKDPYWRMPDYQYSIVYPSNANPLLEIFVLDSDRFDEKAQAWLEKTLGESKAKWKILAFHHPLINNGTKHPSDEMKMGPKLRPLVCGKIDLILSGHEHIFSHLQEKENLCRFDQVIVGTGGRYLHGVKEPPPPEFKVFYSEAAFGLAYFEATPKELTMRFLRTDGTEPYRTTWKKP